jgi:uridine kinase
MQEKHIVFAVAGGSGSGKSSVVTEVIRTLGTEVCLIDQDSYFFSMGDGGGNFDVPEAIDHTLLSEHIASLKSGRAIEKPRYSFATHQRSGESDLVNPAPIIIVEGLFAFWDEQVRANCDLKLFIDAASDLRFIRRLQRDLRERERTLESIVRQYLETVRPMHDKYSAVMRQHADLVLVNDGDLQLPVTAIIDEIGRLRRERSASHVAGH